MVRFGTVRTASFDAIFGQEFFDYLLQHGGSKEHVLIPEQCGKTVLALCSGLMEPINGQVITVDYGLPFMDNTMMRYLNWKRDKEAAK